MENEILASILSELKNLNARQESMEQQLIAFQQFTLEKFERLERRFDGLEQKYDRLEKRFDGLEQRFDGLEQRFDGLEQRFDGLEFSQKKINLIIENEIRPSIQLLAEGQVSMQAQLNRIEEKVTTHDEFIFKRVK